MIRYMMAIGLFLCSCTAKEKQEAESHAADTDAFTVALTAEQAKTAGVATGTPLQRMISDVITVNGVVDVPPQNVVSVSFPIGGFMRSTELLPGKKVRKGDVLCIMEDQNIVQMQQDYLVGREKMKYLEQEFRRQQELNENNINAAKVFQQVSADLNSQKVMMRAMEEKLRLIGIDPARLSNDNLSRTVAIRSPVNGFVSKVFVNTGKYVQPTDVLFELIDPADVHAALTVFQKDVSRVALGQEVLINFINEPSRIYKGKVLLVNRSLDEDRSEVVHCHFVEHPKDLQPGMFLQARIRTAPREALCVPEQAVVNYQGKDHVFVVGKDGTYQLTMVETGSRENGSVELIGTKLDGNTRIVTENAYAVLGALRNVGGEDDH